MCRWHRVCPPFASPIPLRPGMHCPWQTTSGSGRQFETSSGRWDPYVRPQLDGTERSSTQSGRLALSGTRPLMRDALSPPQSASVRRMACPGRQPFGARNLSAPPGAGHTPWRQGPAQRTGSGTPSERGLKGRAPLSLGHRTIRPAPPLRMRRCWQSGGRRGKEDWLPRGC